MLSSQCYSVGTGNYSDWGSVLGSVLGSISFLAAWVAQVYAIPVWQATKTANKWSESALFTVLKERPILGKDT